MLVQERIESELQKAFNPSHLEVINESRNHNVPAGSESHFRVVVVAEAFEGKGLLARHRLINQALEAQLQGGVHALAIQAHTPNQWLARGGTLQQSPKCLGGMKQETNSESQ